MRSSPSRRGAVEVTAQLSLGGGVRFPTPSQGATGFFSIALRADLLALRSTPRSFGLGPYLSVRSDGFRNVCPSLGASLLVPLHDTFPLVLSAGPVACVDPLGFSLGALERIWWGARSYNYHASYVLSGGLFFEARQFTAPSGGLDLLAGADIDLEILAIPWIALYTWLFRRDAGP